MVENGFACYQHEIEERGDGSAHDEVAVAAKLDERDEGKENAGDDPTRVFIFGWGERQPKKSTFKQEEGEEVCEGDGLESAGLGGGVCGEEERGKKKDDNR